MGKAICILDPSYVKNRAPEDLHLAIAYPHQWESIPSSTRLDRFCWVYWEKKPRNITSHMFCWGSADWAVLKKWSKGIQIPSGQTARLLLIGYESSRGIHSHKTRPAEGRPAEGRPAEGRPAEGRLL